MKAEQGERRCFITGFPYSKEELIRFVVGPDKLVYPDISGKLDGRGVWIKSSRSIVKQAVEKKLFSKAFHQDVKPIPELADKVEQLLEDHCLHLLGLANKGGYVVSGYEKLREASHKDQFDVLVEASDGSREGREKIERLFSESFLVDDWSSEKLGQSLGHDFCVHVGIKSGKMAQNFKKEVLRYRSFKEERREGS